MLLIGGISMLVGKGGDFVPITYLGLLGVVPIIMGVIGLLQLFRAMVCLFAWTAYYSLSHRKLSEILGHYGRYATPFILILVGVYILTNTAGDLVAG